MVVELIMSSNSTVSASARSEVYDRSTPGRGYVVIIYGLYIGSIMAVVTAPLGAFIAHWRLGRGAEWLDTHLLYQIHTFWLGILAAIVALLLWWGTSLVGLAPIYAWAFGYLFFTLGISWMMARCAVGIHRLTSNRAIDAPKSWLFGMSKRV
jgi:uncharacterized membrane protein